MSIDPSGLAEVQARMASLQTMIATRAGAASGGRLGQTGLSGSGDTSASGTAFAAQLAGLLDSSSDPAVSTGTATGADAVSLAESYSGLPYAWGGTDLSTGVDCSGLTQSIYAQLGVTLPRTAAEQSTVGTAVSSLAAAQPGDLVFFGSPVHHVGIYAGNSMMVDAPHTGSSVGLHKLWGTPVAIRRVLPTSSTSLTAAGSLDSSTGTGSAGYQMQPYASLFASAGSRYGVDPALLSAVARTESAYDPTARSKAGAIGLMQLMPSTAASLGADPTDPTQSVDAAARLLCGYLRTYNGNTDVALAAYNAGPGAVSRYGGIPPYPETQNYVRTVNKAWEALR